MSLPPGCGGHRAAHRVEEGLAVDQGGKEVQNPGCVSARLRVSPEVSGPSLCSAGADASIQEATPAAHLRPRLSAPSVPEGVWSHIACDVGGLRPQSSPRAHLPPPGGHRWLWAKGRSLGPPWTPLSWLCTQQGPAVRKASSRHVGAKFQPHPHSPAPSAPPSYIRPRKQIPISPFT